MVACRRRVLRVLLAPIALVAAAAAVWLLLIGGQESVHHSHRAGLYNPGAAAARANADAEDRRAVAGNRSSTSAKRSRRVLGPGRPELFIGIPTFNRRPYVRLQGQALQWMHAAGHLRGVRIEVRGSYVAVRVLQEPRFSTRNASH